MSLQARGPLFENREPWRAIGPVPSTASQAKECSARQDKYFWGLGLALGTVCDSIRGRFGSSQKPECWLWLRPGNGPTANMEAGRKLFLPLSTLLGIGGNGEPEKAAEFEVILPLCWVPHQCFSEVPREVLSLCEGRLYTGTAGLGADVRRCAPPVAVAF